MSLAIPSGIVTRSESEPSRTFCIDDRNSAGKTGSQEGTTDAPLRDCQLIGEQVAVTFKYLLDHRQQVAYAKGKGRGFKVKLVPPDFGPDIDGLRWAKGRAILSNPHCVRQERADLFIVKSQSGPGSYTIRLAPGRMECECADYMERRLPCKHIAAVRLYLEKWKGAHPMPTQGLAPGRLPRESYPQVWAAYDEAQVEEIRLFDVLLRDLVASVTEPDRDPHHAGRPPVPLSDQLFCAVQKVYSRLSCRRARGLMSFAVERGQVGRVHHYTLSSEVLNRKELTSILLELISRSALPLDSIERGFAPDSTGIETTSFGAWREEKHGEKRTRRWIKAHALAGVKTHIIAAVSVTDRDGGDNPQFEPLIRQARAAGIPIEEVYADKAYSARANYALAEDLGFDLYVPFRAGSRPHGTGHGRKPAGGEQVHARLWKKAFLYFQFHRDEFEARYHQRSNVESVFSALKRKFGETLRSRNPTAQVNELLAKVLAYNLTVLIHEIFEHGVVPDFLRTEMIPKLPSGEAVGESNSLKENGGAREN
jgi:transposase